MTNKTKFRVGVTMLLAILLTVLIAFEVHIYNEHGVDGLLAQGLIIAAIAYILIMCNCLNAGRNNEDTSEEWDDGQ